MNFITREIQTNDYNLGYLLLLKQLSNYDYETDLTKFQRYLDDMKDKCKILVLCEVDIESQSEKIIGAGTIFKLNKLHNHPVGQIEDVVIDHQYRGLGLGKRLIKELVEVGQKEYQCYKIILNSLEKNIGFYLSCGFELVGSEFKLIPSKV